jgi:predicted Rossmann fold nucleotide-binding protein DprA/Smf involved in DNA uptake
MSGIEDATQRVAIVGSRKHPDVNKARQAVFDCVRNLPPNTVIVSGGAKGVDSWAEQAAHKYGLRTKIYPVDKKGLSPYGSPDSRREYGKRAYARNLLIVDDCDRLVAFSSGNTKGTNHAIRYARKQGKPVEIIGTSLDKL